MTSRAKGVLVALVLLAGGACQDYPSLVDIDPDIGLPSDTLAPVITLREPSTTFEMGDSVWFDVTDASGTASAKLVLMDTLRTVLWTSGLVQLVPRATVAVGVPVTGLPTSFPFGEKVLATAWASDVHANAAYAREKTDTVSMIATRDSAATVGLSVYRGHTFDLPAGGSVGGIVFNDFDAEAYFTDTPHNAVRTLSIADEALSPNKILVGSQPAHLAFTPYAWGPGNTLVVFNDGGTDVSIVDILPGGDGQERWRIVVPIISGEIDAERISLSTRATSVAIQCPDVLCNRPTLFMGSPQLDGTTAGFVRTLAVTDPLPSAAFSILAPDFTGVLPADKSVTVEAFETDRISGKETLLFSRSNISKCGTLAFGSSVVATANAIDGPVFVAESGQAGGTCGEGGRLLRFDRSGTRYTISASAVVNYDYDSVLGGSIQNLSLADDGSVVALRLADNIYLTDGFLRRLATLPAQGASGIGLLRGMSGGVAGIEDGGLLAVSSSDGLDIYELEHFTRVIRFKTASKLRGNIVFARTAVPGELVLLGVPENDTGVFMLKTSISELLDHAGR